MWRGIEEPEKEVTITMPAAEALVLQEVMNEFCWTQAGYKWYMDFAESVREKLKAAYQKPKMSKAELDRQMERYREYLAAVVLREEFDSNPYLVHQMMEVQQRQYGFYFEIVEEIREDKK